MPRSRTRSTMLVRPARVASSVIRVEDRSHERGSSTPRGRRGPAAEAPPLDGASVVLVLAISKPQIFTPAGAATLFGPRLRPPPDGLLLVVRVVGVHILRREHPVDREGVERLAHRGGDGRLDEVPALG